MFDIRMEWVDGICMCVCDYGNNVMGNLCCVYIICGNYGDILLVSFLFFVFFY